jgi:tetratricopeptide (TPR) repeat protein
MEVRPYFGCGSQIFSIFPGIRLAACRCRKEAIDLFKARINHGGDKMSAGSRRLASAWNEGFAQIRSSLNVYSLLLAMGLSLQLSNPAFPQASQQTDVSQSQMRQHYEAAFEFQSQGKASQADSEYKLFLSMALHRMANGHAHLGEYARAVPLYEQALRLSPGDHSIQIDFASAALDAADWRRAKSMSASALDALKSNGQPPDPRAVSVLANALADLDEHQAALEQFKDAAQLRPSFDSFSDLAIAYLMVGDKSNSAKVIGELPARFGDTAALYMKLGIVYGKTKLFDEAVAEFKKAIEMDSRLKGVHYSLGASYMMQLSEAGYDKAEVEFRKELELDPSNAMVYAPLSRIAMTRHEYSEAQADLKHAIQLNQQSTGTYLNLGQINMETKRTAEAEVAFRKAIALALDPSRNNYEVERAHFWLGRLLIQDGNIADGHKELDASRDLLYLKEQQTQARMGGDVLLLAPLDKTHEAEPEEAAAEKTLEKQAGPVIASSFDNLGVNAANAGDFGNAARYFEQAAKWNPGLSGVDDNWSRAAIAAKQFAQALEPLNRVLALHPENATVRQMLGLSLCMVHDYPQALHVLQPMQGSYEADSLVALAAAGSMASAGDSSKALAQLKSLEQAGPDSALLHSMLGEVYSSRRQYSESADQLHLALQLDPSNADTKNALTLADLALGRKTEALQMLSELAESGSQQDGEIHFRLARLQIELGLSKAAVDNLKTAIGVDPMNAAYHAELAEAYRKNGQPEDAERELRQSETLQAQGDFNPQLEISAAKMIQNPGAPSKMQKN